MTTFSVVLLCSFPVASLAQAVDSFNAGDKLRFHADFVAPFSPPCEF